MSIPDEDRTPNAVTVSADDPEVGHLGGVGDTYTVLLDGRDTAGRYCLVDMHLPPGGGPPPNWHDLEETFVVLDGQIAVTFGSARSTACALPNGPRPGQRPAPVHQCGRSAGPAAVHLHSRRAGGDVQDHRRTVAEPDRVGPEQDAATKAARMAKATSLAAAFNTEFVGP